VSKGLIKPDEERLRSLREMEAPINAKSLKRIIGLFAYYSQWIHKFSDKLRPLINNSSFPMTLEAISSFESLKEDIINAALVTIDDNIPLVVESDASEHALAATLSQKGRPIAFFTRMLSESEKKFPAVEKEALAIVEAIRKWRHLLICREFKLITDQRYLCLSCLGSLILQNSRMIKFRDGGWSCQLTNMISLTEQEEITLSLMHLAVQTVLL
jgi:hypothetical protein